MAERVLLGAAGTAAALLLSAAALGQELPAPAAPDDTDEAETPGRGRPLPRDDRTGTLNAFAATTVLVPAGDLGGGLTFAQVANAGVGAMLGVGVGITRYAALDLRGQLARFGRSSECATCSTQMFAGGVGLVYHATQALGFDPWVRYGVGYRSLIVSGPLQRLVTTAPPAGTFHGIDVASFSLGGDYYPVRWFGLGLFFEGDVGVLAWAPSADSRGAVYGLFQAGLRIALEPQRKAVGAASAGGERRTALSGRWDFGPALYNRDAR